MATVALDTVRDETCGAKNVEDREGRDRPWGRLERSRADRRQRGKVRPGEKLLGSVGAAHAGDAGLPRSAVAQSASSGRSEVVEVAPAGGQETECPAAAAIWRGERPASALTAVSREDRDEHAPDP
jgi:hypothetical protein